MEVHGPLLALAFADLLETHEEDGGEAFGSGVVVGAVLREQLVCLLHGEVLVLDGDVLEALVVALEVDGAQGQEGVAHGRLLQSHGDKD